MRRLGRLGSATLVGGAALLMSGCGHAALTGAPAATQSAVQAPSTAGTVAASPSGEVSSDQLNQIDNQIGQANQGLSTSEGDPTQ